MFSRIKHIYKSLSTQNNKQKISVATGIISSSCCVLMSCMQSFTVPIQCSTLKEKQICTINDILHKTTTFFLIMIIANIICFIWYLYIYIFEWKREYWLIEHFDYSEKHIPDNLATYHPKYPKIFQRLTQINQQYLKKYKILKILFYINSGISILILFIIDENYKFQNSYYYDYRTITTFLTNTYICYYKMNNGYYLAQKCYLSSLDDSRSGSYSYYNVRHLSFNKIDPKYKTHVSRNSSVSAISAPASLNSSLDLRTFRNLFNHGEENFTNIEEYNIENNTFNQINEV